MADLDPNIQVLESLIDEVAEVYMEHVKAGHWAEAHAAREQLVALNNATHYAVMNRNDVEFYPTGHQGWERFVLPNAWKIGRKLVTEMPEGNRAEPNVLV